VRLDVRRRLKPPSSPANLLVRHAWKLGLGVVLAVLLTSRGAGPVYTHPHGFPASLVATTVLCGDIKLDVGSLDTATWTATSSPYGTGSPYILPHNDPNLPTTDPNNPNCLTGAKAPDEVHVPKGVKLVIDGSLGPVQVFSHGTGIFVDGGQLKTINTDVTNTVVFDAEPDVASWDGINISAADAAHRGNASLSFVSIQHALTAIAITSGATSSPDNASYGLTVRNSGIGPSYFDGIDATNTPISITGRVDPLTVRPDGQFGTLNNIGSNGIQVTYDPGQPNYPASLPPGTLTSGTGSFGATLKTAGSQSITAGDGTISGQLTPITVNPLAAKTLSVGAPATATAGSAFDVTVAAKDPFGNTATGYTGSVQFSGGGSGAILPGPYMFTVGVGNDNGTHTFSGAVTLKTAGNQTITATDTVTGSITGSQAVAVSAAGTATLLLTYSGSVTHGVPFSLTVIAQDLYGNTAASYAGTVHFTSTDPSPTLPADYIFTIGGGNDNGQRVFLVTLSAAGTPTVTATDKVTSTITGTVTVTVS
jgi:hypothetical protein